MSSKVVQFDFFKAPEISTMEVEFAEVKESVNRVRKGLFARHNKLSGEMEQMRHEFEELKRDICRGAR